MTRQGENKREDSPFQKIERRAMEIRSLKRSEKIKRIREMSASKRKSDSDDGDETSKEEQEGKATSLTDSMKVL